MCTDFISVYSQLLEKINIDVVILMTLRRYTFNGWMDWGSIQCVNIKKFTNDLLKMDLCWDF